MDVGFHIVIPRCNHAADRDERASTLSPTPVLTSWFPEGPRPIPYLQTNGAYRQVDNNHIYWLFAPRRWRRTVTCAPRTTTRRIMIPLRLAMSSSARGRTSAAGASHDPCVLRGGRAVLQQRPPRSTTPSPHGGGGQSITVKGIQIPVGATKAVGSRSFSDAKMSGSPGGGRGPMISTSFTAARRFARSAPPRRHLTAGRRPEAPHLSITPTKSTSTSRGVLRGLPRWATSMPRGLASSATDRIGADWGEAIPPPRSPHRGAEAEGSSRFWLRALITSRREPRP
jgi:hypothetical protein